MGFLDSLTAYTASKWEEVTREKLSKLDAVGFKQINSAEVVEKEQDWGTSVSICMFLKDGKTRKYVPLSSESELKVGDKVDPKSLEIIELERDGETCYKADGKAI